MHLKKQYECVVFSENQRIYFVQAYAPELDAAVKISIERLRRLGVDWDKMKITCNGNEVLTIFPNVRFNHISELF